MMGGNILRKHQLPVHGNPQLETECYHNVRLSVVLANDKNYPWVLSHFVNLYAQNNKDSSIFPHIRFEEHVDIYEEVLDEQPFPLSENLIDCMQEALQAGNYFIAYLNYRYLPSSIHYRLRDMIHETLLYGYDEDRQCFLAFGFDINGKAYSCMTIDYRTFYDECKRLYERDLKTYKWFTYYGYPLTMVKPRTPHEAMSLNTKKIFFALERGRNFAIGPGQFFALGYTVNGVIEQYFCSQLNDEVDRIKHDEIWNIMIYKMLQHQKMSLKRIKYLRQHIPETSRFTIADKIIDIYLNSGNQLLNAWSFILKYKTSFDRTHLYKMCNCFDSIYKQEKKAVPLFMEMLVDLDLLERGEKNNG